MARLCELFDSVLEFLKKADATLKDQLWFCHHDVFYLSDFFGKMNEVLLKLQGDGVTHPFEGHHTQSSHKAGAVWKKFEQA